MLAMYANITVEFAWFFSIVRWLQIYQVGSNSVLKFFAHLENAYDNVFTGQKNYLCKDVIPIWSLYEYYLFPFYQGRF